MCSIANLFNTNLRKFDGLNAQTVKITWKNKFSLRTKLVYLRLNFISKSKALNLRQPKLSASYKESLVAIFQSQNVILNLQKLKRLQFFHPPITKPTPPFLVFPYFQQKLIIPPLHPLLENLTTPPFYEGGGGLDCADHRSKESIIQAENSELMPGKKLLVQTSRQHLGMVTKISCIYQKNEQTSFENKEVERFEPVQMIYQNLKLLFLLMI